MHCVFRQLFWDSKLPGDYERDTRAVVRELARNSGQLPSRYQVKPGTLSVDGPPIASAIFWDLLVGKLGGKTVAVKNLKPDLGCSPQIIQKVRLISKHFSRVY